VSPRSVLTGSFDFDTVELPIMGASPAAVEASASGAALAQRHYGRKLLAYVAALAHAGSAGLSDFAAVDVLGAAGVRVAGVHSINSIRAKLGDYIEHTDTFDTSEFGSKRGRYRLSAGGRLWWQARQDGTAA
jgi:hypothetical protein